MFVRPFFFADGLSECNSDFTEVPKNQAAFVGSDCVLKCAINDSNPLGWKKDSIDVYTGYEFAGAFKSTGRFEVIGEKYDLRIRRVQPSDAGEYECGRNKPTIASAQLVIIGKLSLRHEIKLVILSIFALFRDMLVFFTYRAFY